MSLISLTNVNKSFFEESGECQLLQDINLDIQEHSINIILGSSGSGKTTLLNIIEGIEDITSGNIVKKENLHIGYVTQHAHFIEELNIEQNLKLASYKKTTIDIPLLCEAFNCQLLLKKKPRNLSGGEKQRVNIVRSLLTKPDLLILDEPTAALDHDNKIKVVDFLQTIFDNENISFIVVTHDSEVVEHFKNKIVYKIKNKQLIVEQQGESNGIQ